jgi:hypothetical protein
VENQWGTRDLLDKDLNEEIKKNPYAETKRYFSINETKRNDIFFGTETENRNEINIFQKRNGTKKKLCFLTPGFDTYYGTETVPRQVSFQHLKMSV